MSNVTKLHPLTTAQIPPLTTEEFAKYHGVKPESVRVRLCRTGHYFGVRPTKARNGRLLWPADGIA